MRAGFLGSQNEQSVLQIQVMAIIGKQASGLFPAWVGDLRVGKVGGVLIATCKKPRGSKK